MLKTANTHRPLDIVIGLASMPWGYSLKIAEMAQGY
jgi:hypothetical protein